MHFSSIASNHSYGSPNSVSNLYVNFNLTSPDSTSEELSFVNSGIFHSVVVLPDVERQVFLYKISCTYVGTNDIEGN